MDKKAFNLHTVQPHKRGNVQSFALTLLDGSIEFGMWWAGTLQAHRCVSLAARFRDLHERRLWLACTCTDNHLDPPLVGLVVKNGSFSLRRLTDRAQHSRQCVFWSDQNLKPKNEREHVQGLDKSHIQPDFLAEENTQSAGQRKTIEPIGSGTSRAEHMDSFARPLFWLLEKAAINRYPCFDKPVTLLLATADKISLTGHLKLSDVLFCNSRAWHEGWMAQAFERSHAAGLGQQAILICPVIQACRAERWVKMLGCDFETPVEGRLAIYGDDVGPSAYPMLMYAKVRVNDAGQPVLVRAYLHPVYSTTDWCSVDSNNERTALKTLLNCCKSMSIDGIQIDIEKPLSNWNSTGTRPDFVLTSRPTGKTLIVETMGFDDQAYIARKARLVSALAEYHVYEDVRTTHTAQCDALLHAHVQKFFGS